MSPKGSEAMTVEMKQVVLEKVAIGQVSAQIYQDGEAAKCSPVLLYFHGGAFLRSGLEDCPLARCFAATGAIVVVPYYTAPLGGVFPHPLEVGFSIFCALAKKRAGFGDRKSLLIVAGAEAGANIAAAVALKARDQFASELDGQVLASPLLDPFMGSASFRNADDIGMRRTWEAGWAHYLSGGICHPYAAPSMCSRLGGVAPALVLTSQDDPLRDETAGYAKQLTDAGACVQSHTLPAATGWPSVYGGTVTDVPTWQEAVGRHFTNFIRDLGPS
ncbi:MAG: nlhH 2 [Cypionkella sp.]|nr:nlhH 2 [Cypionkella sp.]